LPGVIPFLSAIAFLGKETGHVPVFSTRGGQSPSGHLAIEAGPLPHHPTQKTQQRRLHRRAGWFLARFARNSSPASLGGTLAKSGSELVRHLTRIRLQHSLKGFLEWVNVSQSSALSRQKSECRGTHRRALQWLSETATAFSPRPMGPTHGFKNHRSPARPVRHTPARV